MDAVVQFLGGEAKTVAFAILSAVFGFIAKAIYDLWVTRTCIRAGQLTMDPQGECE